jgi:type I restriction enzyme, R subunit
VEFLETIKQFLTRNGRIDPVKLYESPFKNFHNLGISGVFSREQEDKIFRIIERVNGESRGA